MSINVFNQTFLNTEYHDQIGLHQLKNRMFDKASILIKYMARLVGVLFIAYGVIVGILGIGPDGPMTSFYWRIIGIFILFQGILYLLSNSTLKRNIRTITWYLFATFLPAFLILIVVVYNLHSMGIESFVKSGGLISVSVLLPTSVLSPISLIFSVLGSDKVGGTQ